MLKDISAIKITGANFNADTELDFFNSSSGNEREMIKASLVYGKNGTGKTTIARAFSKLSGEEEPHIIKAGFLDANGNAVNLAENEQKQIFVFDENYVHDKVLLQEDHLDTIVMLGEAADLTKKIEEAEEERKQAKEALDKQKEVCESYENKEDVSSPKYYSRSIQKTLQGDDHWAGRDSKIHGRRRNATVKDDTYKKFVDLTPSESKLELLNQYNEKLQVLLAANTGEATIDYSVPHISDKLLRYDDVMVQSLLSEKIERPQLTEREKKLFALVQEGCVDDLTQRLSVFSDAETRECPYCYQPIEDEYKDSLVKGIEKVLSKEVENHQVNLQNRIINFEDPDLSAYKKLDHCQLCIDLVAKMSSMIQYNNECLQRKAQNPYQTITADGSSVKQTANELVKALTELEKDRLAYNKANSRDVLTQELDQINAEIAHYEIADLAKQLETQQAEYDGAKGLLTKLECDLQEKERITQDLEAQRSNIKLAVDVMNASMRYIFFAEDRLVIECNDGVYKLYSHGRSVKPSEVSAGERNIIGLCYFFTNILEGKEESQAYEGEYLLVIDDPISSYDTENRVGMLSFLKYKLNAFLTGNKNTRVLILTHDLMTFYDTQKALEEIMNACKQGECPNKPAFKEVELADSGNLQPFSYRKRQEYTEMIKMIYYYACEQDLSCESVIGNVMRQVLEAFSTFIYKKGIEDVSTDDQILSILGKPEYILYFKNLMYRLVLHGGSHREEQIRSMSDFRFFDYISKAEKVRTARDVLCFIYLLNERHLLEHLKECKTAEYDLNSWCQDILTRSVIV